MFHAPVLLLLGCPEQAMGIFVLFTGVNGLFKHCNVDVRLGPLNWIVRMAELHRWHHSSVFAEASANYGSNTMLWDRLAHHRHPEVRRKRVERSPPPSS